MGRKAKLKLQKKLLKEEKLKLKGQSQDKIFTWATLALVTISILSLAFTILKPGLPSGHDIGAHISYAKLFGTALAQGQFPVRWIEWIQNGFSLPLFNFYQVGFYYLVNIIHSLIPSLNESIKITILLLWWTGAGFMFLFMRKFGNIAGAISALIYAFTPYLILDIFVRAAYPELTAISFSIGVLWALDRLVTKGKPIYALPLSILLGIVTISHLPTLLILSPILLGYTFYLIMNQEAKLSGIIYTTISVMLGIGLASFYLLPALLELNLVKSQLLTSAYYDFHPHFVYPEQLFSFFWGYGISQAGPEDGISFQIGIIQWIIIVITIATITLSKILRKKTSFNTLLWFWLAVILYGVFFMHETSLAFWENFKIISFIQYPWRFLMVVVISCAAIGGTLTTFLNKNWQKAGSVILIIIGVIVFYRTYLNPAIFLPNDYFNIDSNTWKESRGVAQNVHLEQGYLPKGVEQLPDKQIPRWNLVKGNGKLEEKLMNDHQIAIVSQSNESFIVRINSHYFPGWKAYIDNSEAQIDSSNSFGFMDITVPTGLHKIEAKLTNTPIRSVSNTITVISLLILIFLQLGSLKVVRRWLKWS